MGWDDRDRHDLDEGLDRDGPSAEDLDRFGDEFIHCPNCGKAIYDQAEICPHCGQAVEERSSGSAPWAILVTALLVLFMLIGFLSGLIRF